jgi:hypothetical protein
MLVSIREAGLIQVSWIVVFSPALVIGFSLAAVDVAKAFNFPD